MLAVSCGFQAKSDSQELQKLASTAPQDLEAFDVCNAWNIRIALTDQLAAPIGNLCKSFGACPTRHVMI